MTLSDTMKACLEYMGDQPLVKTKGGYWARPDEPNHERDDRPARHFGTNTVTALLNRDRVEITGHKDWDGPGEPRMNEVQRTDSESFDIDVGEFINEY